MRSLLLVLLFPVGVSYLVVEYPLFRLSLLSIFHRLWHQFRKLPVAQDSLLTRLTAENGALPRHAHCAAAGGEDRTNHKNGRTLLSLLSALPSPPRLHRRLRWRLSEQALPRPHGHHGTNPRAGGAGEETNVPQVHRGAHFLGIFAWGTRGNGLRRWGSGFLCGGETNLRGKHDFRILLLDFSSFLAI
jgi:hypothetical protein